MADEVELIQDGEGLAVIGNPSAVEQFLDHLGLQDGPTEFPLGRLGSMLDSGSRIAELAAEAAERSGRYVKLTKDSAEKVRELGLMPTDTKDISHAMIGIRGSISQWIQVETGPAPLLTNPAILSGAAGIMAQLARMIETQKLEQFLDRIDGKLDDVRRRQRDKTLAQLRAVSALLDEAMFTREHGGHRETSWDKLKSEKGRLLELQETALSELGALADKAETNNIWTLAKATRKLEEEAGLWLAVLARCFQLHDNYLIVELDHVFDVAPESLDGHRLGLEKTLTSRRTSIISQTDRFMERLEKAGAAARQNVLLHAAASREVVGVINALGEQLEDFHALLGIDWERPQITPIGWLDAVRDPNQWRNAAVETGPIVGGAVLTAAVTFTVGALLSLGQDHEEPDP